MANENLSELDPRDRKKEEDRRLHALLDENEGVLRDEVDLTPQLEELLDAPANGVINAINRGVHQRRIGFKTAGRTDPSETSARILEVRSIEPEAA